MKKTKTVLLVVFIAILSFSVGGVGGYIAYSKYLIKYKDIEEKEIKEKNEDVKKEEISPETELAKILNGDCSYVAGSYKNGKEETIILKNDCDLIVAFPDNMPYYMVSSGFSKDIVQAGEYMWNVHLFKSKTGGSYLSIYPIGVEEPFFKSDNTRIRILMGQGDPGSIEEVYIKQ